jgi:phenylalanyl-tRNA synthetase beta chain
MKISYKWLTEYIDIKLSVDELAQKITDAGIEVEEIITLGNDLNNVVVAKIESVEKHPDADKLKICGVNDGENVLQVICGAPNVKQGQIIPFARNGARLANGITIKKAKIRGVESNGMICSKEELGLELKSDGIWPLDTDLPLGSDFNIILNDCKDYILDLFVTSNRPDCLSHIGIAREVAAFTGQGVKYPEIKVNESDSTEINNLLKIKIEFPEGCPRYAARLISNVKIGPSPDWLKQKLERIGLRSINNVVDVTNYVLNEIGQPLHAFDYDLIKNHQVIVKKSRVDEKFTTLDNKTRQIPKDSVMICDAEKSVAIGGIMGGLNSEVNEETSNILLESACFNPTNIASSSRKLGLVTDASSRFEKGTDVENVIVALNRATQLIQQLAGGEIAKGLIDEYPVRIHTRKVPFRPERVNKILGTNLSEEDIYQSLQKLNIKREDTGMEIPSYRVDLIREIDLVEEVARLIGLDDVPASRIEPLFLDQEQSREETFRILLRTSLLELGLNQAITNSMLPYKYASIYPDTELLKILNPISDDLVYMRPSLLQGLLLTISFNKNRNMHDTKFFEMGNIFSAASSKGPQYQPYKFALALSGNRNPVFWDGMVNTIDFYDIKGLIEQLLEKLNVDGISMQSVQEKIYETGFSLNIILNKEKIGSLGKLDKDVLKIFDIKSDVFFAELNFDILKNSISLNKKYKSIGKYPYIEKDLALLLDNKISSEDVINFIKIQGGRLLRSVQVFDVYVNKKEGKESKSIAFRLKFQSDEKTLTDEETDRIFKKVIDKCVSNFNARLRES